MESMNLSNALQSVKDHAEGKETEGRTTRVNISLDEFMKVLEHAGTDEREQIIIKRGIESVRALINDSSGVYGLHLNGDPAPWSELEFGGRFEEWLSIFDEAEDIVSKWTV